MDAKLASGQLKRCRRCLERKKDSGETDVCCVSVYMCQHTRLSIRGTPLVGLSYKPYTQTYILRQLLYIPFDERYRYFSSCELSHLSTCNIATIIPKSLFCKSLRFLLIVPSFSSFIFIQGTSLVFQRVLQRYSFRYIRSKNVYKMFGILFSYQTF